jgi:hypothetical protein
MPDRPDAPLDRPFRDGRLRKRWHWVGAFADDLMVCAAVARIGPARVTWWALWDREMRTLAEHTRRRGHSVRLGHNVVEVADGPVRMDLRLAPGTPVETLSPHGGSHIWTRKTPVRVTGGVSLGERHFTLDAPGLSDESAGYHAHHTSWRWSAGVGTTAAGVAVTWNLVTGVHDASAASERTVWLDGVPHHVPPQAFADDLSGVGGLAFTAEATRVHKENLVLLATDYVQPFGSFAGTLPVAGEITGYGVMERQAVRW